MDSVFLFPISFLSSNLCLIVLKSPIPPPLSITSCIATSAMPRKLNFNSARAKCSQKNALETKRGVGDKFAKGYAKVCVSPIFPKEDALNCEQNISPSPIRNDYDMDVQHQITKKSSNDASTQNISPSPIRNDYDMDVHVQHQITKKSSKDTQNI